MDEKTQNMLSSKFNIIWMDSDDYFDAKENITSFSDPILQQKFSSYFPNTDPLYYTFGYQSLIKVAQTKPNIHNLFQNRGTEQIMNKHTVLVVPKTEYFFKGMRTFYADDVITSSDGPKWFGEETIAFKYAKRYHGGINVYKPINNIKLLVYSNINNIRQIIKHYEKNKPKLVFPLKIKTGVDISFIKQIEFYMKYNKYETIWLNRRQQISETSGLLSQVIPGMSMWGRGKIDRDVGIALCQYCAINGFDGYISYEAYTPFMPIISEEIVLCDYFNVLKRDTTHPIDWIQWEKYLPIKLEKDFLMADSFANRNNNFQIIKFWNDNRMDTQFDVDLRNKIKKIKDPNTLSICTFNIHSFYSINFFDTVIDAFNKFIIMINNFSIDLVCVQEFATHADLTLVYMEKELKNIGYNLHFIPTVSETFGNAIISKFDIDIQNNLILPTEPRLRTVRKLTTFNIYHEKFSKIIFGLTHLDIGSRYTSRQGSILQEFEVKDIMVSNSILRKNQIEAIINSDPKPNIILGDLNSEPSDPEIKLLFESYYTNMSNITHTTPFDTIVDYIFYDDQVKKLLTLSSMIKYRYSDHLPIINILKL